VQKITRLVADEERIQLRLLTDIALASSVKYASSNAYVDETIGCYGTRDVLLSMDMSELIGHISNQLVTTANFYALVVEHMLLMFGIKIDTSKHDVKSIADSVKELATAVTNCDYEARDYTCA
jgi:hypothetical protein